MRQAIEAALTPLERALFRRDVETVVDDLKELEGDALAGAVARRFSGGLRRAVEEIESCLALSRRSQDERRALEARFAQLSESLAGSDSPEEQKELMMEFLALITPPERLAGDRLAFRRYMGLDCVAERYQRVLENKYRREEILVKAIGALAARIVVAVLREPDPESGEVVSLEGGEVLPPTPSRREGASPGEGDASRASPSPAPLPQGSTPAAKALRRANALLKDLRIEPYLLGQVRDAKRWQNRVTAFRAIGQLAAALPQGERSRLLSAETSNFMIRCCLDQDENVWIQRGALELLCDLTPREALRVLERRLLVTDAARPDDFLVRAQAVFLLPKIAPELRVVEILSRLVRRPERSEYVRMQVVRTLAAGRSYEAERLFLELLRGEGSRRDRSERVRAEAAAEWRKKAERDPSREEIAARVLAWLIRRDESFLVRRVALEEAVTLSLHRQRRTRKYKIDRLDHALLEAIDDVCRADPDIAVRRVAEEAREAIVVRNLPAFAWVEGKVAAPLAALDEGEDLRIPKKELTIPDDLLGRILAFFTRDDFGIVVDRRGGHYVFQKGDRIGLRLWRVVHELRNLDSAKRQAFRHTTGRFFRGALRIHPGMLAELMETKVPGERLWNEAEQSWRRFLPLVDDYLSLFSWLPWRRQRAARIVSSQGLTEIRDKNGYWRGLGRYLKMCWRYAQLAGLRNAHERNKVFSDPAKFSEVMREEYGIETRFAPAEYRFEDEAYRLEDATLAVHFERGVPKSAAAEAAPAAVEAIMSDGALAGAREDLERTPLAPEEEEEEANEVAGAALGEEIPASSSADEEVGTISPMDAGQGEVDDDSIDALLRPLALAPGMGEALGAGSTAGGGDTAGSRSAFDNSGSGDASRSGTQDGEDTQDDLEPSAAPPAPIALTPFAPDETLAEFELAAAPESSWAAPATSPASADSGRLGDSDEISENMDTGDEDRLGSTAALAPPGKDSAGEIEVGGAESETGPDPREETGEATGDESGFVPSPAPMAEKEDTSDEPAPSASPAPPRRKKRKKRKKAPPKAKPANDETGDETGPADPDETGDESGPEETGEETRLR